MNPGLVYLLRRAPAAKARRLLRRLKTGKGMLALAGTALFLLLVLGPQVLQLAVHVDRDAAGVAAKQAEMRLWGPVVLLILVLLSVTSIKGIYFRPSEIDFLFPAPIPRRQLVLYNVLNKLGISLFSSLWVSIFVTPRAGRWYFGVAGVFLAFAFLQLVSQLLGLLGSTLEVRVAKRWKRLILLVLLGGGAFAGYVARDSMPAGSSFSSIAKVAIQSPVGRVLTAPTSVYVEAFLAADAGSFCLWGGLAAAILLALFGAVVGLDVAYADGAIEASRRLQARLARARSGGVASSLAVSKARWTLPALPRLGGAGPVAWRQFVEMTRHPRAFLTFIILAGFALFPFFLRPHGAEMDPGGPSQEQFFVLGILVFFTIMLSQNFAFDFRRDVDRMAFWRSLPLSPGAVAAGQILPAAVVLTVFQGLLVAAIELFVAPLPGVMLIAAATVLFPINWLAVAIDNLVFLLLPYRFVAQDGGGPKFPGRLMIVMLLKLLCLGLCLGIGFLVAALVASIWQEGWILAGAIALSATLAGGCVLVTWLAGMAYGAFDITRDVPG